jgi:hypothetical protein
VLCLSACVFMYLCACVFVTHVCVCVFVCVCVYVHYVLLCMRAQYMSVFVPTWAASTDREAHVLPPSKVSSSVCRVPSKKPGSVCIVA